MLVLQLLKLIHFINGEYYINGAHYINGIIFNVGASLTEAYLFNKNIIFNDAPSFICRHLFNLGA